MSDQPGVGVNRGPSDQTTVRATAAKRYGALVAAVSCGVAILVWLCVRLAYEADAGRCGSPECDRYAAMLHNSSAPAANPCEDFYEYVCARWSGPQDSVQHVLQAEVVRESFTLLLRLDVPASNQRASHKAAKLLQTCLAVAQTSRSPAEPLIRFLRHVGLLWPLPSPVVVLDLVVQMSLYWGIPVWGAFRVDTFNRDIRHRPLLVFGEARVFDEWLERKRAMLKTAQYELYLSSYLRAFGLPADRVNDTMVAIAYADGVVEHSLVPFRAGEAGDDLIIMASLMEGSNLTDTLNRVAYWIKENYTADDILRVHNIQLLLAMLRLTTMTPAGVLSLSFGWSVARQLGQYVSRDLAMVQYFAFEAAEESLQQDCLDFVWSFMTISVGAPYVERSASTELRQSVASLIGQLRDSLESIVRDSAVLTRDHQQNASFRLHSMKTVLFWPEGVRGEPDVNRLFGDVPDLRMPAFLDNWFLARQAMRNFTLSAMAEVYHFPLLSTAPLYDAGNNVLAVPVGAAAFPMYSPALVPAANFGGLARTLSAALAGALFWERHHWVRGAALSLYRRRLDCLVAMYHTYQGHAPVTAQGRSHAFDGVDESAVFAVSWSLAPLHRAYRAAAAHSPRSTLGRERDAEQLFFASFCYSQCSRDDSLHSRLQCNVPLRNFPAFASAFRCSANSYMNPHHRCLTW
ncbi:neprilysin-1-like [Dermacentor andersoni]|uniref:neprilysin-1-like n=1 Tax=Dermacentor andersoni TaxID=34620 RepID=UPI002417A89A|nr:neprilysin-1-like [Dermacentor andersoni]